MWCLTFLYFDLTPCVCCSDKLEEFVKQTAKFQDNFEVYIQTLISQALDSNFLTEIFQEKGKLKAPTVLLAHAICKTEAQCFTLYFTDEYFLSNVKTIDDIVEDQRKRFLQVVKWRPELEASIATWPCYNVIFELVGDEFRKNCACCDKPMVSARVLLYGQPYNSTTLEGCQADPKLVSEKVCFIPFTCKNPRQYFSMHVCMFILYLSYFCRTF